jgi:hypothetical protein
MTRGRATRAPNAIYAQPSIVAKFEMNENMRMPNAMKNSDAVNVAALSHADMVLHLNERMARNMATGIERKKIDKTLSQPRATFRAIFPMLYGRVHVI